jgi:hypothetical protein
MHTVVLLPSFPTKGPTSSPQPFLGNREQVLDLSPEELSTLVFNNRGYLQRRNRRSDDLVEVLFPHAMDYWGPSDPVQDVEVIARLNDALWEAGYVPTARIYHESWRHQMGDVFRWEFSPTWGFR